MKHVLSHDVPVGGVAATASVLAPGWYGKLPSLGDFASRRMPPDFLQAWDAWLAAGLADWSAREPDGWLAAYLAAPSWRFLMLRPVGTGRTARGDAFAGHPVTAGVLMPSVDRFGRYFPFTLARSLPRPPADAVEARGLLDWLHRADDLAVDALHDNWTVDTLESELGPLGIDAPGWFAAPAPATRARASSAVAGAAPFAESIGAAIGAGLRECSPCTDPAALLAARASAGSRDCPSAQTWWWCADAVGVLHLRISVGLPNGADFAELLGRPIGGGSSSSTSSTSKPGDLP